ncbi:hypothetical protein JCM33374_g4456 [Metschnikowia sp. JCM 33374]|nr:hypothetical protein JCM33374_g4456 [Metschnikowia sp. JCM 33374]
MSEVQVFDSILKELPTLRAPGVSGTRIKKLTDIAVKNVAEESQLITVLYSSCKATPSSHKLGALYVVDSIVRVYMDEAKKRGEEINSQAPEGTFAAGVFRIGELVESLIDDAMELSIAPATTSKIGKLVDIWERASTFSPETIAAIRKKHFDSLTPKGSPVGKKKEIVPPSAAIHATGVPSTLPAAPTSVQSFAPTEQNKAASDSGSILSALASLAKKTETPTPPQSGTPVTQNSAPAPGSNHTTNILSQLSALAGNGTPPASHSQIQSPPVSQAQPQPGNKEYIFNMLQSMQGGNNGAQNPNQYASGSLPPQPHGLPPQMPPVPQTQGMPPIPNMYQQQGNQNGYQNYQNDRRGRDELGGYSRRNRSRSPQGRYNRYEDNGYGQQRPQQRNTGQSNFGAEGEMNVQGNPNFRPRNMGFDNSLPQGSFKVLSRTLFIGGVPPRMDERELASHLRPHAVVQSIILNNERKHAFVKVYSRKEAEQVIQSFNKDGSLPLRTRWGVGFGPRDCCNYQHGISIIPIQRLTEADRTWVVSAQWGGTGGVPLESGMVIDEPDIEIGTGVSSKAMSRKMPTNATRNGPKSNRPGVSDDQYAKPNAGGGPPDFRGYSQGPNPLSGLFANQAPPTGGYPPQMPPSDATSNATPDGSTRIPSSTGLWWCP